MAHDSPRRIASYSLSSAVSVTCPSSSSLTALRCGYLSILFLIVLYEHGMARAARYAMPR